MKYSATVLTRAVMLWPSWSPVRPRALRFGSRIRRFASLLPRVVRSSSGRKFLLQGPVWSVACQRFVASVATESLWCFIIQQPKATAPTSVAPLGFSNMGSRDGPCWGFFTAVIGKGVFKFEVMENGRNVKVLVLWWSGSQRCRVVAHRAVEAMHWRRSRVGPFSGASSSGTRGQLLRSSSRVGGCKEGAKRWSFSVRSAGRQGGGMLSVVVVVVSGDENATARPLNVDVRVERSVWQEQRSS